MSYQLTVGNGLLHSVYKYPEKMALVDKDRRLTYHELNQKVNKLANGFLDLGLKKGDKISILLNNRLEYLEVVLACAKVGLVVVPLNFRYLAEEILYCVNNSHANFVITETEFIKRIETVSDNFDFVERNNFLVIGENVPSDYTSYEYFLNNYSEREPDIRIWETDLLYIGYTSGTTGKPKGAMFSHRSRLFMQGYSMAEFGITPFDKQLLVMPLFHSNGLVFGLMACTMGSTLVITQPFDPMEFLSLIEQEKINYVSVVPTILNIIFSLPEELTNTYEVSSLHTLICSSSPLMTHTKEKALEFFKQAELSEFYGSSEAGLVTVLHHREAPDKVHCVGRPCMGMNVKILDQEGKEVPRWEVGELYSWGVTFEGYYQNQEATEQAIIGEWLTVGDMAKMDEDGYIYLVDRKKDMIMSGGENVYPTEVEEVLSQHPQIIESAVIGIPDPKWGEIVKAVVILQNGASVTENEIIDFCKSKLSNFKCPKSIDFIDELPKTLTGKILRRKVREQYWQERDSEIY